MYIATLISYAQSLSTHPRKKGMNPTLFCFRISGPPSISCTAHDEYNIKKGRKTQSDVDDHADKCGGLFGFWYIRTMCQRFFLVASLVSIAFVNPIQQLVAVIIH